MTTYVVDLPWHRAPLSSNRQRGHPAARGREYATHLATVRAVLKNKRQRTRLLPHPLPTPVHLTLHYSQPDRIRRDVDGLAPVLKVCMDALVQEGWLPDDNSQHVPAVTMRMHPTTGPGSFWLEIETP